MRWLWLRSCDILRPWRGGGENLSGYAPGESLLLRTGDECGRANAEEAERQGWVGADQGGQVRRQGSWAGVGRELLAVLSLC